MRHNGQTPKKKGGNVREHDGRRERGDVCAVPHFNHELFAHVVVLQGKPEAGASRSRLFCFAIVGNQGGPKHVCIDKPQLES